jgi:hypothetical protein
MVLSFNFSFLRAAQVLRAVPEKVELGTFNTFQIKETIIKLSNTGKKTFLIDKIKANCTCVRTSISTKEIPPGETVELKIAAMERTGGDFSHDVLIIPTDKKHYEPLKIQATGTVIEPVSAEIGWEGRKMRTFDPNGPANLGLVHYLSVKPVIKITANGNHFNLSEAIPDVNSTVFELRNCNFEKFYATNHKQVNEAQKKRLVLSLTPRTTLKTGVLQDIVKIRLADNVGLEMPIQCLVVRDVYAMERMIHFGNLTNSTPKKFTIYFTNNTEVWSEVKWNVNGYLSDAVVIMEDQSSRTDSRIVLTLAIDQSKIHYLPKGYVFCRIIFFQKQPTENHAISILADGFNEKQLTRLNPAG